MTGRPRFTPNHKGLEAIATSPRILEAVTDIAESIAREANGRLRSGRPGYVVEAQESTGGRSPRARAVVIAATYEAQADSNANHTLPVVAGAGGGL